METVLVIEDRHELRDNIVEILELAGYKTLQSVTPRVGFETLQSKLPQIVVFDIMIEEKDVIEFFSNLFKDEALRKIPTVILDGNVVPPNIVEALKDLKVVHVSKPFPQEVLVQAVKRCSELANQ